jgi:hypothetical protein
MDENTASLAARVTVVPFWEENVVLECENDDRVI